MRTSVLSYLEESAKKLPDKVAFFDEKREITFSELKRKSVVLGRYIKAQLSGRRNPILVYLPKDVSSIIAFMGILYSGNFYTPTDIRFPDEKIVSVMNALHPRAVVVNHKTREKLTKFADLAEIEVIDIEDALTADTLNTINTANIMADVTARDSMGSACNSDNEDLQTVTGIVTDNHSSQSLIDDILDIDPVYVFFTSGSTGVPKGVIINNHNIIDYIDWAVKALPINEATIMGNQSPFYFDISTQDIYATLKTGATLGIIPPKYFAFPAKALQFIKDKHINFLYWVPSAFVNVANFDLLKDISLYEVELIMFGGEVMPVKQLNYWKKYLPNLKTIANVYGPTEATVNCT